MVNESNYNLWCLSENYLNYGNNYYSITSVNREDPVIYRTASNKSLPLKIAQVASYCLIFLPLTALIVSRTYRVIFSFNVQEAKRKVKVSHQDCDVVASKDCKETQEWRKKLISVAQHNIVISGNYCGGKAFDEILHAIDLRMSQVPGLQVVIIGHPKSFKTDKLKNIKNHELLKKINKNYSGRFTLIRSPNGFLGTKRITNHTKCTVIDYGRYFIQGGSGIQDNFVDIGLLDDPKHKLKKAKSYKDDGDIPKNLSFRKKPIKAIRDDLTLPQKKIKDRSNLKKEYDLVEDCLPGTFRDQDFIFQSKGECETGKRVYREALFLALKWDQYEKQGVLSSETWDLEKLSDQDILFKKNPALSEAHQKNINEQDNRGIKKRSLEILLKTKIPDNIKRDDAKSIISDFMNHSVKDVFVKTFFTGPEDRDSDWESNMIERIESASRRIVIDQMYFQPSKAIMDALIKAGKRNVNITIITACGGKHVSMGEKFFGSRNCYNLYHLFASLKNNRENLHLYAFTQAKNGLHKKIVIIDNYVLAGSSNLGTKSLILTGDHEMNFEAHSKELAHETMKILEDDIRVSKLFKSVKLSFKDRILATVHSLGAFWWG